MSQEARTAFTVLSPAVAIAALFLLVSWRPWQRREHIVRNGHWGGPCALGLGFLAAFFVIARSRGLQLQDRWHWIAPIALTAMALGAISAGWRHRIGMQIAAAAALALACGVLLHPPAVAGSSLYWKIGLGAAVVASWLSLEPLAQRRSGVAMPLVFMIAFSGLSIVLLETHQAGFSLLAAAMSAMCGAAFIVALLNPQFTFAHGGMYVIAAILTSLSTIGWMHNPSRIPVWPFAIIVASPLMMWLVEARFAARLRPWQATVLRTTIVAIPVVAAVVWTLFLSQTGADEYGY